MKLTEILAISGQPGLFKFVAQSRGGIIVEALSDSKRMVVAGNAKVSALNDIAIFTIGEDMPLANVFELIYRKTGGKPCCSHKSSNDELKAAMESYVPDYDKDRVRVSDMKKLFAWFNLLLSIGMTEFVEKEEAAQEAPTKVVNPGKGSKSAVTSQESAMVFEEVEIIEPAKETKGGKKKTTKEKSADDKPAKKTTKAAPRKSAADKGEKPAKEPKATKSKTTKKEE
ncbi:MAG: DUF5606 domain-containing protein [Rikenellaceae bacterium]|nr:DUF5606 domain-containing protein [Rikenellaceae bacterium]